MEWRVRGGGEDMDLSQFRSHSVAENWRETPLVYWTIEAEPQEEVERVWGGPVKGVGEGERGANRDGGRTPVEVTDEWVF